MATKLATFDPKPSNLTQTDRRQYPWNEWLDGNVWEIRFDEDFTAHPLMMERIIRTRATAKKAKVEIRHRQLNGSNKTLGDGCGIIVLRRSDVTQPRQPRKTASKIAPAGAKKSGGVTDAKKVATKKAAVNGTAKVNGSAKKAATKMTPAKKAVTPARSKKAARA